MRIALVLGSGGARGYAHIGVIEELKARGHEIVAIAGTSMGALVGGLEASGGLPEFTKWATNLTNLDVFRRLDFTVSGGGVVKADKIIDQVTSFTGDVRIEDLPIPFTAVASDITAQREVWFQRGSLANSIRASIAIPGFITPVKMHGHTLVDGGVCNPVPIEPTLSVRSDVTVAVSLDGRSLIAEPNDVLASADDVAERSVIARFSEGVEELSKAFSSKFLTHSKETGAETGAETDAEPDLRIGPETGAAHEDEISLDTDGKSASTVSILMDSIGTMQGMIERYRASSNPAQVHISVPYSSASTLDFLKAPELIELGRTLAREAFDAAGM